MELKEGNLCFICDEFMDKYGIKYSIMENKGIGNKRPAYFCFRDSKEKEILWFIPMSTQYEKYQKIYIRIKEKIKKEPNNFVFFENIAGKRGVFLIQNMFPTLENYVIGIYKTNNGIIKVPKVEKAEVLKKSKEVLRLTNLGKIVTLTNLPQFLSEIKSDVKHRRIFMNIQESYIPYEIDWGEPQGKEIWWN